jgi:hypothetical protein
MSWARVDDAWWSHRKVIGLDLEARGLWVSGLSYASHQREPLIPEAALPLMRATPEIADRLVDAGLWQRQDDGYLIHDWDDYQSTSAKRAEAGRRGGEKSGQARAVKPEPEPNEAKVLLPESKKVASTKQAQPNPTQPDPAQPIRGKDRPRNELWDAVVEACGWNGQALTKSQQGRTASAVKELSEIGAEPAEVRRRAANYRLKYPGMDVTPTALSANWASIASGPSGVYTDPGRGGVYFND